MEILFNQNVTEGEEAGSMELCRVCIGIEQIMERCDNNITCFVSLRVCFNFQGVRFYQRLMNFENA